MRLLRISQPRDCENFFGYLLKLSEINHFERVNWLVQLAGLSANASTNLSKEMIFGTDVDLSVLSGLSGEPSESLEAMRYPYVEEGKTVQFCGHPVSVNALRPMLPKICPACLSESNHTRMVWDLAMVSCCPIHRCLLIDHCPGCGKRITWYRKGISKCRCNFDFRTIAPEPASEVGSLVTRLAYRLLGIYVDPLSASTPLADLTLDDLFTVVSFFSSYLAHKKADTSGKAFDRGISIAQLHRNLADVAALFSDWPHKFIHFLQTADFAPAKNAKYGLYHRFGSFYPSLKRLFDNEELTFIQDTFEKYLLKYFSDGYVRHRNLKTQEAHDTDKFVSQAKAAEMLKTSERWIDRLLESGRLKGIKIKSGKKHLIQIEKSSVESLAAQRNHLLPLSSIKQLLRIKSKNVLTLVHNDLLSCERGPTIDGYPTWQFSIADLQGLFSSIERHIPSFSGIDDKAQLMTFYDTRQLLSANHFSTLEFYRLVVSGKLRPCQRMDMFHIDSFLFDKLEVKRFVKKRLKELYKEGYTMKEFKDLIGVGLDVAYDLEKNGKIKAQYSGMPKVGKIISQEAAEQFHSTYVTSSAIAKACKVSANTVIKCLSRAGKHPVSGPSVDGGACYLYLRKDLADFDFASIQPSRRAKRRAHELVQMPLFDIAA